jgi:hypothetical protein
MEDSMSFPKHEAAARPTGLDAVGEGLERLAGLANTYVGMLTRGEVSLELFTGKNAHPVSVNLTGGEATEAIHAIAATLDHLEHLEVIGKSAERIASAFERIAAVMGASAARQRGKGTGPKGGRVPQ